MSQIIVKSSEEYRAYRQSSHWLQLVNRYIKSNNNAYCWICSKRYSLVLHHDNYDNLGKEKINKDIYVVCWKCHKKLHFWLFGLIKIKIFGKRLARRRYFLKWINCIQNGEIDAAMWYFFRIIFT